MGLVNSKAPEDVLRELDTKWEGLAKQNGTFTYMNPMYNEQPTQSRQSRQSIQSRQSTIAGVNPMYEQPLPKPPISDLKKLETNVNRLKNSKSTNEISRILSNYKYIYPVLINLSIIKNFKKTPRSDPLYENRKIKARKASIEIGLPPPV
jgi:hypothetical protein